MKRLAISVALILLVAACGGDNVETVSFDEPRSTLPTAPTTTQPPMTSTTEPPTTTTTTTEPPTTTLDPCSAGTAQGIALFDETFDLYDSDPSQMLNLATVSETVGTIATLISNDCDFEGAGESLSAVIVYLAGQAAVRKPPTVAFIADFLPGVCESAAGAQLSSAASDVCSGSGQGEASVSTSPPENVGEPTDPVGNIQPL